MTRADQIRQAEPGMSMAMAVALARIEAIRDPRGPSPILDAARWRQWRADQDEARAAGNSVDRASDIADAKDKARGLAKVEAALAERQRQREAA